MEKRTHEFVRKGHETRLTTTLWENFVLFDPGLWLPKVFDLAGLSAPSGTIRRCQWTYEWQGYRTAPDRSRRGNEAMCDVVVGFGESACSGVLVIEAKALGKKLREKDLDPDYYLGIKEIVEYGERASLVYLVDEKVATECRGQTRGMSRKPGVLTWQQLGGLQIELALDLAVDPDLRRFIASSIQFQFAQNGIFPDRMSAGYLEHEPSMLEIDAIPEGGKQPMSEHLVPLWRFE